MGKQTHSIQQALQQSEALRTLQARSDLGRQRMAIIDQLLSPVMARQLRSGACDDSDWCILAPNAAIAAKLRQWLPAIAAELIAREHKTVQVRIKVSSAGHMPS